MATQKYYDLYSGVPPYVPDRATSKAAAESIAPSAHAIRSKVLAFVKSRGRNGATCDEVEASLDLRHQTASARIRELYLHREIAEGGKRATRSGRQAVVWVVMAS
jgi:hypothetical protein